MGKRRLTEASRADRKRLLRQRLLDRIETLYRWKHEMAWEIAQLSDLVFDVKENEDDAD